MKIIFIYKVALSVCLSVHILSAMFSGATLRDRLACSHRANESSFRRRIPVQSAEVRRDFRLFFVWFPTCRERTPIKPHSLSPFLSFFQPPPTNVQQAVSSHTIVFSSPCTQRGPAKRPLAAEAWPARKRSLEIKEKMCSNRPLTRSAWLPERRVIFGMNYFETANSQAFPPATDHGPLKMKLCDGQTFSWSRKQMEAL